MQLTVCQAINPSNVLKQCLRCHAPSPWNFIYSVVLRNVNILLSESQKDQNFVKSAHLWWWCYSKRRKLPSKSQKLSNPAKSSYRLEHDSSSVMPSLVVTVFVSGERGVSHHQQHRLRAEGKGHAKLHLVCSSRLLHFHYLTTTSGIVNKSCFQNCKVGKMDPSVGHLCTFWSDG